MSSRYVFPSLAVLCAWLVSYGLCEGRWARESGEKKAGILFFQVLRNADHCSLSSPSHPLVFSFSLMGTKKLSRNGIYPGSLAAQGNACVAEVPLESLLRCHRASEPTDSSWTSQSLMWGSIHLLNACVLHTTSHLLEDFITQRQDGDLSRNGML